MNYNYLRYFSVLAQVEHYTLAAARLGISQPSLSSAIHHLEDELGGIKLFEKTGRNIRLTEEGVQQAEAFERDRQDMAQLLFATLDDGEKQQLMNLMTKLHEHWENCTFERRNKNE